MGRNGQQIVLLPVVLLVAATAPSIGAAADPAKSAAAIPVDEVRAAAAGIRKLPGRHLTLYTDLPPSQEVDELPAVFDQAVPQWAAYFAVPASRVRDWHLNGFLMKDKERFLGTGLLPAHLPPFPNGYQRGPQFWWYDQTTDYYRRHLMLHEGTHAFMDLILGGLGPPWYAEGMAELLGTHRWHEGKLSLAFQPQDKTETPGWGRVKIIKDEVAAGRGMRPDSILAYGATAHLRNEPYGWCWGLAMFLDTHPRYQQQFRALRQAVLEKDLTARFRQQLEPDWQDLCEDWQLFVMNIEYGYDVARAAVERKPAAPLPPGGTEVKIQAGHGWQSTGVILEGGATYRLESRGRYQVAHDNAPWWCEPGGVTIHYYQGRPLGMLLAAVSDDQRRAAGLTPLARPEPIGLQRDFSPTRGGTLYLKINESAARLADNQGQLTVRIQRGER
jgi:hypothetical protein